MHVGRGQGNVPQARSFEQADVLGLPRNSKSPEIFLLAGAICVYVMGALSYAGIALLMGIESACIPLPSELIMPYAGAAGR